LRLLPERDPRRAELGAWTKRCEPRPH